MALWHRYEGQPFHPAEFVVEQDYYQPNSRAADLYARGTVDGNREWMDLVPYLQSQNLPHWPHGRAELELAVPPGNIDSHLFFPQASKVEVACGRTPTRQRPEAYYRTAMNAVKYGGWGMAGCTLIIFLLMMIRARGLKLSESAHTIPSGIST